MKHRTFARIVPLIGAVGWLVTAALLVVVQPWGLSFQHGTLLWVVILALLPYFILSLFSASTQFPPFGRWVLCATTVVVAAGGISLYSMSISNSCMGGMAIILVPAFQVFAVGAGLILAIIAKLIAYFRDRRASHDAESIGSS